MHLDGADLSRLPLDGARRRWPQLTEGAATRAAALQRVARPRTGPTLLKHACKMGLEGIVSKLADAPYRSGRGHDWIKTKCSDRQEFVVAGFAPSTADAQRGRRAGARLSTSTASCTMPAAPAPASPTPARARLYRKLKALEREQTAVRAPCRRRSAACASRSGSSRSWWPRSISTAGPMATACGRPRSRACARTSRPRTSCAR